MVIRRKIALGLRDMWTSVVDEDMVEDGCEQLSREFAELGSAIYVLLDHSEQVVRFVQHGGDLVTNGGGFGQHSK